jgi:hypothetical protein
MYALLLTPVPETAIVMLVWGAIEIGLVILVVGLVTVTDK